MVSSDEKIKSPTSNTPAHHAMFNACNSLYFLNFVIFAKRNIMQE